MTSPSVFSLDHIYDQLANFAHPDNAWSLFDRVFRAQNGSTSLIIIDNLENIGDYGQFSPNNIINRQSIENDPETEPSSPNRIEGSDPLVATGGLQSWVVPASIPLSSQPSSKDSRDHDAPFPTVDLSFANIQQQLKTPTSTISALDLSKTFFLSSLPSASQTIYLDFDGNITTGTYWNTDFSRSSINTPAFNFDGNAASFSDAELQTIQYIWQRVAEDFSPFNVNVTTQAPADINDLIKSGPNDTRWGVRVAIGGSSNDWLGVAAGGVAYVGSFNWNSDTPAFVFPQQLGNGNEKYTADAITHEVGHTLGLDHDGRISPKEEYYAGQGSGETGWAPVMGVGYYQNLVQWSKGEYTAANNTEDDLTIITTQNGFGYRADDAGNSITTAKSLTVSGTSVAGNGIIERNTDVDYYSFSTGSGSISLTVNPFSRGPNLDILAQLYNASGTLITSSNPVDLLSAAISTTVTAGTYYLAIDGVGKGNPLATGYTDYGSLGQYFISGNIVDPATIPTITLALSPNSVLEDGTSNLVYTFTRSGDITNALTVNYSVGGTATFNSDYSPIGAASFSSTTGTIIFAAGGSTATLSIDPTADTTVESDETVALTLSSGIGYNIGTTAPVTGTILNDDFPDITLAVSPSQVTEDGSTSLVYTFARTGSTASSLTINYGITGTADSFDYTGATPGNSKTITFASGASTATLTIDPTADTTIEPNETVTLTLTAGIGYTIGIPSAVTGTIINDDPTNQSPTNLTLNNNTIAENSSLGALVGSFSTTDPDIGDTFTYSLVSEAGAANNNLFTIQGNQLQATISFDFEAQNSYSIRVRTTDQGGLSYEKQFAINVSDVNESPTNLTLSNSIVSENQALGTAIGNFSTIDPDIMDNFTYNLVSGVGATNNNLFTIQGNQLQANAVFNYEATNSYSIRVRTTDQGGLFFDKLLTININDIAENLILGTATNNILNGTNNADRIEGLDGNDKLYGLNGNDDLYGGNGNDTLDGGAGIDALFGGAGNDIYSVDNIGDKIIENIDEGTDTVYSTISYTLGDNVENLILQSTNAIDGTGNDLNNSLSGNAAANILIGGLGNDNLNGGAAADTLIGDVGNDNLNGGVDADTLIGGAGNDIYSVDNIGDKVIENLDEGIDIVYSTVTYTLGDNVENLSLQGANTIDGTGNDLNNSLSGNAAANILIGGLGNDNLNGGAGADTLIGGLGKDTLTGGVGSDRFDYKTFTDSLLANFDVIKDFNATTDSDLFIVSTSRAGFTNAGAIAILNEAGIAAKLNSANFGANYVAQFTVGTRTFVAINDATAGFSAATDAIIEVTGLTGTLTSASFVTV